MARFLIGIVFVSAAFGQDAVALLEKSHTAMVENAARARFWTWTAISTRKVEDKSGKVLEELPSVTVESPIRSDGKRCNAVVAWGDGREAYLANASADERCAVEKEIADLLPMDELFKSRQVKVQARTDSKITLAIRQDKIRMESTNPVTRCVASVEATIEMDAANFFPRRIDIQIPSENCEQKHVEASDHYDGGAFHNIRNGYLKGTHMRYEYEVQKAKSGDAAKNYWLCVRRSSERPLPKNSSGVVVSGRLFKLKSKGPDRRMIAESVATGSELSAESVVKFATEKER